MMSIEFKGVDSFDVVSKVSPTFPSLRTGGPHLRVWGLQVHITGLT